MSAPQTNIDKQSRRHRWSLIAIGAAAVFGAVMFFSVFSGATDDDPAEDAGGPVMTQPDETNN
jgi:hypothetical protein